MRIEGTLTKWNDDRGFGFITPTPRGPEVFVHISAFPRDGRRPAIGERLTFEIDTDPTGKRRAMHLLCPDRPAVRATIRPAARPAARPAPRHRSARPNRLWRAVPLVVFAVVALVGYGEYSTRRAPYAVATPPPTVAVPSHAFRCDGRTHCSQMTSCAEATYFLRNCPNVKMDGNRDGVPCEQQWCTSPLAR